MNLSEKQRDQLEDLENTVSEKLKSILTPDQVDRFQGPIGRGPGRRPDGAKNEPPAEGRPAPRRPRG